MDHKMCWATTFSSNLEELEHEKYFHVELKAWLKMFPYGAYYLYIIRYLFSKYMLIYFWVLKVFGKLSGELNTERRVRVFICHMVFIIYISLGTFSHNTGWYIFEFWKYSMSQIQEDE